MKEFEEKGIKKVCSFCVSDWHLTVMMLPYISQKIEQDSKIITLLEEGIEENINTLLNKLNIKEENKTKIKNIKWTSQIEKNNEQIREKLKKEMIASKENIVIINGTKKYIDTIDEDVEDYVKENKIKNTTIINCYEVVQFNQSMSEILEKHDTVLNTSGERKISEVFDGYCKKEAI